MLRYCGPLLKLIKREKIGNPVNIALDNELSFLHIRRKALTDLLKVRFGGAPRRSLFRHTRRRLVPSKALTDRKSTFSQKCYIYVF